MPRDKRKHTRSEYAFLSFVFCENHEERRKGKRKEDSGKKKAFAFFYIEITLSFSSLFPFIPQKASRPSLYFHGRTCG
jgi:hypothetical protein